MTRFAGVVFAAVLAFGCSNGNDGPPYACERNDDCPHSDEPAPFCAGVEGCTPRSGCDPISEVCLFRCASNADCEGDETCTDSFCRLLCETAADCYAGWSCDTRADGAGGTVDVCIAPANVE
jgi:hypothetical protein